MNTRERQCGHRNAKATAGSSGLTRDAHDHVHCAVSTHKREETESARFLRIQQKLVGRKTTEDYARIRLVRRQDEATRKRNLHQNGCKKVVPTSKAAGHHENVDSDASTNSKARRGSQQLSTARDPPHQMGSGRSNRPRPQSAKPLRSAENTVDRDSGVAGRRVSVALLERCYYNPVPLTTHLAMSRSAPRLHAALQYSNTKQSTRRSEAPNQRGTVETHNGQRVASAAPSERFTESGEDAPARRRIVVYMQHLEIKDDSDDDEDTEVIPSSKRAGGPFALDERPWDFGSTSEMFPSRCHGHDGTGAFPCAAIRSAWGDAD